MSNNIKTDSRYIKPSERKTGILLYSSCIFCGTVCYAAVFWTAISSF